MTVLVGRNHLRIRLSVDKGKHIITAKPIQRGAMIAHLEGPEFSEITQHTLSMYKNGRVAFVDDPILGKLAHSCSPNVLLSPTGSLWALEDIAANHVLTMDYASEEALYKQFPCACGAHNCRKWVTGHGEQPGAMQQD